MTEVDEDKFMNLATEIYHVSHTEDYPNHFKKQLPGIFENKRNILFVRNSENEIIAVACLRNDEEEQKICVLCVRKPYRGLGIGTRILEESIKWLGTTKPLATFPDYKLEMYRSLIETYDWELTEIVPNLYQEGKQELCFNGTLTKNQKVPLNKQLYKQMISLLETRKDQIS